MGVHSPRTAWCVSPLSLSLSLLHTQLPTPVCLCSLTPTPALSHPHSRTQVRVFSHERGKQGGLHPHANATSGDEVLVHYVCRFNGTEIARTPSYGAAVRLGRGLLPPGLELALTRSFGVNGSATVRLWGAWATNSTFLSRQVASHPPAYMKIYTYRP